MTFSEMQEQLQNELKESRYQHTMGVVNTARTLADRYGADRSQAETAALLHDCAKYMPLSQRISYCESHGVPVSEAERRNLTLLHAKCGSILAREHYGVTDPEILHAISVHTTGEPAMNLLDQIIFVSDYIEPGRNQAPHLEQLRKTAQTDLEETVYRILSDTVEYLKDSNGTIDTTTNLAYQYYQKKRRSYTMYDESRKMASVACAALEEKKAEEIKVIDISEVSVIADYFVIATAGNQSQMSALVDNVDEKMYKAGYTECRKEGNHRSSWFLIDYKDIIIHIFLKEDRLFYDLERIWKDGKLMDPEDLKA